MAKTTTLLLAALLAAAPLLAAAQTAGCGAPCSSNKYCLSGTGTCYTCRPSNASTTGGGGGGGYACAPYTSWCNTKCVSNDDCGTPCGLCNSQGICVAPSPAACGRKCYSEVTCAGTGSPCTKCINGTCAASSSVCGAACQTDSYCVSTGDGECQQCIAGQCRPTPPRQCGAQCAGDGDCLPTTTDCKLCRRGRCVAGHQSKTCSEQCTPGANECGGDCSVCGLCQGNYCCGAPLPPGPVPHGGCGQPCGKGGRCGTQCTYCSPDGTCAIYMDAARRGNLRR